MAHHYEGDDLIVRKIEVGTMENNVYVLECPQTHKALIVDGCFEPEKIIAGVEGTDVVGIIQTHGHTDHVQALADIRAHFTAPLFAHNGDSYPIPIDQEVEDGDVIEFGTREAKVIFTPGHSPGSTCFLVGDHLIAGDTLFPGGPGATWGDKQAFAQIISSIERKLFTLPEETRVYPGHGKDTTIGDEKPHLQEWIDRGW